MDEIWVRAGLIAGALATAGIVAGVLKSRGRAGRARKLSNTGLESGVYFFSSSACADCRNARKQLDQTLGPGGYRELAWEREPDLFDRLRINAVPMTLVVEVDGSGVLQPGSRIRS